MITEECANRSDVSKEESNKLNKREPFMHHRAVQISHTPTTQNMTTPRPQIHEEILWLRWESSAPPFEIPIGQHGPRPRPSAILLASVF